MARRFDAAETLVEQQRALSAAGIRVRSAVQVSPGHPGTPAGVPGCHLGEHLTSPAGPTRSRKATRRAAVAVAVCNAVLWGLSDPEVAEGADRVCARACASPGLDLDAPCSAVRWPASRPAGGNSAGLQYFASAGAAEVRRGDRCLAGGVRHPARHGELPISKLKRGLQEAGDRHPGFSPGTGSRG